MHLTVDYGSKDQYYDENIVLDRLIKSINQLSPMALPKDIFFKSMALILREATMRTDCG